MVIAGVTAEVVKKEQPKKVAKVTKKAAESAKADKAKEEPTATPNGAE